MVRNNKIVFLLFFCVGLGLANAQIPSSNLYFLNILEHNSSYAGSRGKMSMFFSTQIKWAGVKGSPKNYYLGINLPVKINTIGLALEVSNQTYGPRNTLNILGSYAYKLALSTKTRVAIGVRAGIIQNTLDYGKLNFENASENLNITLSETNLRVDLSAFYNASNYFIGISYKNLAPVTIGEAKFNITTPLSMALNPTSIQNGGLNFIGGYIYQFNKKWRFKTMGYLDLYNIFIPHLIMNLGVIYDRVYVGLAYSSTNMMTGIFEWRINNKFALGYAVGFNLRPEISIMSSMSHEILLNYDFRLKKQKAGVLRGF